MRGRSIAGRNGIPAGRLSWRPMRIALLVAAIAFWIPLPARAEVPRGEDPHAHFRNPGFCSRCHLSVDGKPAPGRFVADADAFCLECHRSQERRPSHPRGVRPRDKYRTMKVPAELRLDGEGRILCLTCHRGHGEFLSAARAFPGQQPEEPGASGEGRRYRTYYARRADPVRGFAPLCGGCHPDL